MDGETKSYEAGVRNVETSPIQLVINANGELIDRVQGSLIRLSGRLAPVKSQHDKVDGGTESSEPQIGSSEIIQQLLQQQRELARLERSINEIARDIEV